MIKKIDNIGDCGIVCDFGDDVNKKVNNKVIKLFNFIMGKTSEGSLIGIKNCAPSYNKLIINFDLKKTNTKKIFNFLNSIDFNNLNLNQSHKQWIVPICYDMGVDLDNISRKLKIRKEEIIKIHSETVFFIYMIGFIPGHPFMGDLDKKIYLDRLETPRVKVPSGSVGIVEKFCNIYPYESPGGWNIIGRTPIKLFNINNSSEPCLFSPGDTVKFKQISEKEYKNLNDKQ